MLDIICKPKQILPIENKYFPIDSNKVHIREIVFSARELEDRRNNPESFAKEEYKRRYHQMVYNVYKIILEKKTEDQIEKEFPISFISGKKKKKIR